MSTSGGVVLGAPMLATAHLTAAAVGTLFSVPTTIIAAPGANKVIDVLGVAYESVAGNSVWAANSGGLYYAAQLATSHAIEGSLNVLDLFSATDIASEIVSGIGTNENVFTTATVANSAVIVGRPTANPVRSAPIATKSINAAGTAYVAGDTGTIDSPTFGTPTGYVIDTVGALGIVTAFHLTASTAGYDPASGPFTTTAGGSQPGIGTGFQVNVLTIAAATGDLYVTVHYSTVTTH